MEQRSVRVALLAIFLMFYLVLAAAASTVADFETTDLSEEKRDKAWKALRLTTVELNDPLENTGSSIVSFDVSPNGLAFV